jgi:KUP system potassium uptake protein
MMGALGVVYGDIGTSPLYALRECFHSHHGLPVTAENILGILSLVFWSLMIIISIKYLVFVMRADNRGEGGILALAALIRGLTDKDSATRRTLVLFGLFGAALLYGDGMITPAISVLSAVEGAEVASPALAHYVVPITIFVLVFLFALQKRGTAGIGAIFGPVMCVWFIVIAALGISQIIQEPHVWKAIDPLYGFRFFRDNGMKAFLILGSVFLVVTGGEALYADMGHFGVRPIRIVWFTLVLPALLLNYFGQGAHLLHSPEGATNPFFHMAPAWSRYPLVALSTVATVIASQAVISGAFSLTRQAVQLGYSPRVNIRHTSEREIGQIYIPAVNWVLMFAAIGLVVTFRESSNLAAAYGVAVTTTMGITTILLAFIEHKKWKWSAAGVVAMTAIFLTIDLAFFGANIIKVVDGGWFPLLVGVIVFTLMTTWRRGREILHSRLLEGSLSIDHFMAEVAAERIHRVNGTAVFMSRTNEAVPPTLLHNLKHNKVLHKRVVMLTIVIEEVPRVAQERRYEVVDLGHGVCRLGVRLGFMEDTDLLALFRAFPLPGLDLAAMDVSFFLGRETLIATRKPGMAVWRERLFGSMSKNASSASTFFELPPNQIVELGAQIEL